MPSASIVRLPYWPCGVPTLQLCVSPTSTSEGFRSPEMLAVSSLMVAVAVPVMVGTSFVPLMVIVTLVLVPSAVNTSRVSVKVWPTPSAWTASRVFFSW
ncbi:hypothetical protein D3C71_1732270 [compost metagenome]